MMLSQIELKKYVFVKVIPLTLLLIWLAAVYSQFLEPLSKSFSLLSILLMKMFSSVCHQDHDKSVLLGKHIYVCARCAGIYTGCFLSAFTLLFSVKFKFNRLNMLTVASALLFADVLLVNIGLYKYSHITAFITGLFFGSIIYLYLIRSIEDFVTIRIQLI